MSRARAGSLAAMVAMALIGGASLVPGAAVAASNPPGNNGTVNIDARPFDAAPDNEPHVGCTFQVDFYGYDEGDLEAQVSFEAHAPTLRPDGSQVLLTDSVFIGEDDNSGGGSEAGLDARRTYRLDFAGMTPHPVQGLHVKLSVNAEAPRASTPNTKCSG